MHQVVDRSINKTKIASSSFCGVILYLINRQMWMRRVNQRAKNFTQWICCYPENTLDYFQLAPLSLFFSEEYTGQWTVDAHSFIQSR